MFSYKFRPALVHFADNHRLLVFCALWTRRNAANNRCWPSTKTIARDTGLSADTVVKARQWLLDVLAIRLVPYELRTGDQRLLPERQFVYEFTGAVYIDGHIYNYLEFNETTEASFNHMLSEVLKSRTSENQNYVEPVEVLKIRTKGIDNKSYKKDSADGVNPAAAGHDSFDETSAQNYSDVGDTGYLAIGDIEAGAVMAKNATTRKTSPKSRANGDEATKTAKAPKNANSPAQTPQDGDANDADKERKRVARSNGGKALLTAYYDAKQQRPSERKYNAPAINENFRAYYDGGVTPEEIFDFTVFTFNARRKNGQTGDALVKISDEYFRNHLLNWVSQRRALAAAQAAPPAQSGNDISAAYAKQLEYEDAEYNSYAAQIARGEPID